MTEARGWARRVWQGPWGIVLRVVISLTAAVLVVRFVAWPTQVSSSSMSPTYGTGDRVIVKKLGFDPASIERGDVVVFGHGRTWLEPELPPDDPLRELVRSVGDVLTVGPSHRAYTVKRAVGIGGDVVECCSADGRVVVNGVPVTEPWAANQPDFVPGQLDCATSATSSRCFGPLTVPKGRLLLLGDNRGGSADSVLTCRGQLEKSATCAVFVPADQVVGTVWFRLWPLRPTGIG